MARFEPFLEWSLAAFLWYHVRHAVDDPEHPDLEPHYRIVTPDYSTAYHSCPRRGGVKRQRLQPPPAQALVDLTEAECRADPFLSITAGDYLNGAGTSYAVIGFLSALADCPSAQAVRLISRGYPRWWAGSLLGGIAQHGYASPEEYARLADLFQRVLRIYDCGIALPESSYSLTHMEFPVVVTDDTDLWMGVWSEDDVSFVVRFLRSLLAQHPRFRAPDTTIQIPESKRQRMPLDDPLTVEMALHEHNPGYGAAGLASRMTDDEWNAWVHRMIGQLLQVEAFRFERPTIVSFIDS